MGGHHGKHVKPNYEVEKKAFRTKNRDNIDNHLPITITDYKHLFYIEPEDKFRFSVFQLELHQFTKELDDPSREVYTKLACNARICRETPGLDTQHLTNYCGSVMLDAEFILTLSIMDNKVNPDDNSNCIAFIVTAPFHSKDTDTDSALDYELKLICAKKGKIPVGIIIHSIMVQFLFNNKKLAVDNIYLHAASHTLLSYYTALGYLIGDKKCAAPFDVKGRLTEMKHEDTLTDIHIEVLQMDDEDPKHKFSDSFYAMFDGEPINSAGVGPYNSSYFLNPIIKKLEPFMNKDRGIIISEDGILMKLCGWDAQTPIKSLSKQKIKKLWSTIYSRNIFTKKSHIKKLTMSYKMPIVLPTSKTFKIVKKVSPSKTVRRPSIFSRKRWRRNTSKLTRPSSNRSITSSKLPIRQSSQHSDLSWPSHNSMETIDSAEDRRLEAEERQFVAEMDLNDRPRIIPTAKFHSKMLKSKGKSRGSTIAGGY